MILFILVEISTSDYREEVLKAKKRISEYFGYKNTENFASNQPLMHVTCEVTEEDCQKLSNKKLTIVPIDDDYTLC